MEPYQQPSAWTWPGMARESENLLRRCRNPIFAVGTGAFYLNKVAAKFIARPIRHVMPEVMCYPKPVRRALREVTKRHPDGPPLDSWVVMDAISPSAANGRDKLKLATGYYPFTESPSWEMVFEDPEQTESLHRWNWLLIRLTDEPFPEVQQWGLRLMRDWIGKMWRPMAGLPWESYTTGERICNAVLFMALSGGKRNGLAELPQDLARALIAMARFLAERLEYNGSKGTGNHVINNARALYFAGQALRAAPYTDLSVAILNNDLQRVVNSDGFLCEGSSHYHFLVTRWLLEMLWMSRITGERRVYGFLDPIASLMVERCWFFLVHQRQEGDWVIPLVGDVSPDFSWDWLIDLPWSSAARGLYAPEVLPSCPVKWGWRSLFDQKEKQAPVAHVPQATEQPKFQSFPASGWYRLDWGPITVFWHVEPSGASPFGSHGHCDIGSFCLYWDGVGVLTDPGRLNYRQEDPLGMYGISARSHSSVLIDGHEPFVCMTRSRYPRFYQSGNVEVRWFERADSFTMSLQHTGFCRLWGDRIVFSRAFRACRSELVIEDSIQGRSRRSIETYFQWAPGVEVSEDGSSGVFGIKTEAHKFQATFYSEPLGAKGRAGDLKWRLVRGESGPFPGGWYFPGYGEKIEATTLFFRCQTNLPYGRRYVLKWGH